MVPEFNKTASPGALVDPVPPRWRGLVDMPWSVPGCTGIIATNKQDGTVYHARNQDLDPVFILRDLVYEGVFQKGGQEVCLCVRACMRACVRVFVRACACVCVRACSCVSYGACCA